MFHIQQAFIYLIVHTHFESPPGTNLKATLLHDINYWDRHGITWENVKYHLLEPLVMQGWTACVLAIFYDFLHLRGYIQKNTTASRDGTLPATRDYHQFYKDAITRLRVDEFLEIIESIHQHAFTCQAWSGTNQLDKEFITMCRYLQEVETFMTLQYAIRHGDIGIIWWLVDPLCVWFYGAEQPKYGMELLYLRWLLTD